METLDQKYEEKIIGKLSFFGGIVIKGTLPEICYAEGITSYLYKNKIRIFDYPKFAN